MTVLNIFEVIFIAERLTFLIISAKNKNSACTKYIFPFYKIKLKKIINTS